MSRSALIRKLLMGQKVTAKPPEKIKELLRHLSSISNNINQIARVANSNKFIETEQLEEIQEMQSRLWQEIKYG